MACVKGYVSGNVQGVGFRYFVKQQAQRFKVCGYVKNLADGRVEFVLQGDQSSLVQMLKKIEQGPLHAKVNCVEMVDCEQSNLYPEFNIG